MFIYFFKKNTSIFLGGFTIQFDDCSYFFNWVDTVDGKDPAPVHGKYPIIYTVVQDFFHQQYHQLGVFNELEMPSEEVIPR